MNYVLALQQLDAKKNNNKNRIETVTTVTRITDLKHSISKK
ncbi:class III lanthipeptide [Chengkuizengella marina]|nr:class III lanthipeptide [Chengkuizengella marina]